MHTTNTAKPQAHLPPLQTKGVNASANAYTVSAGVPPQQTFFFNIVHVVSENCKHENYSKSLVID